MSKTKIDWADMVWNPVTGCSKISEGCQNCYAERKPPATCSTAKNTGNSRKRGKYEQDTEN